MLVLLLVLVGRAVRLAAPRLVRALALVGPGLAWAVGLLVKLVLLAASVARGSVLHPRFRGTDLALAMGPLALSARRMARLALLLRKLASWLLVLLGPLLRLAVRAGLRVVLVPVPVAVQLVVERLVAVALPVVQVVEALTGFLVRA